MMKYDPKVHHRRSIRLKGYDYSQPGAYFVTICTKDRACVLDDPIVTGIINDAWQSLPSRFPNVVLDEFVIMPNHIHLIVWIVDNPITVPPVGTGLAPVLASVPVPTSNHALPTLGDVVGAFKSLVFKMYLDWIETNDPSRRGKFWQHNYYEHIVRNDRELDAIRRYITANPRDWALDRDNLSNLLRLPPPARVEEYLEDIG